MAHQAASISARIISQVRRGACFAPSLPVELHDAILIIARHPVRKSGSFKTGDLRLVCKQWNELHKKDFWRKKWLPLRPDNASWESIGERLKLLAKDAEVIKNVKIEGRATQVLPITLEDALRACPEIADIQHCQVQRIQIGLLDSLSEILLKQILLHRQDGIRHFGFRFDDTILFLGRRSMFVRSELLLPEIRRITVDISSVREAPSPEDVHHNSAGLVSLFIAELIGREDRTDAKRVELRVFCKPDPVNGTRRPQVTQAHILLAAQIYDFTRAFLEKVAGLKLVVSFQAPFRAQVAHNRRILDIWGRENDISLLNT
uniref:F-box domain-containing protein n=2 Tax=Kalmanozyma brasiliensis (strain GHG001) TaxID=1365824 RepID=V5EM33_KALBG